MIGSSLYRNDYYISLVVSPRGKLGTGFAQRLAKFGKKFPEVAEGLTRELEDQWFVLANGLEGFNIRRLGVYEHDGIMFSEMAEALRLIITGRYLRVPIVSGHMGDSLYTDRVICGRRGVEIRAPDKSLYGTIFSFREYPAKTRPGMLNTLLSAPFPLVLSQSFAFVTRAQAQDKLSLKSAQMVGAQDKATSQIAGLDEAADASRRMNLSWARIISHWRSTAIISPRSRIAPAARVAGWLTPAPWWWKSGSAWKRRSGRNCRAMSNGAPGQAPSIPGISRGCRASTISRRARSAGHWGRPIARFRTDGGTAYDYVPHVADVAMTIIFGPIGSGKTALLMFLLAMFEQAMVDQNKVSGTRGSVVFFDKDRGGELLVRASGGTYLELRRGEASGMSPLRGLQNTEADKDFLRGWIIALIQSDDKGTLNPDEEKKLERAIARQLQMPVEMRSLAGLREFLGHSDPMGIGPRLEKWCRGNALGWAFDGERDDVVIDEAITGFDMTQLLEHDEVCAPAGAYLLYRVTQILDGRRVVLSIDEFRFYLRNPQFASRRR